MRVFHGFNSLPQFICPVVTVGSYDGVHLGHRALIDRLVAEARTSGGESIVLTFEPHPRITLGRAEGLLLLTTLDEKVRLLETLGVDNVIVIPFDRTFSALSGEEFVREYLLRRLGARTLVVGITTDLIFTPGEMRELHAMIPGSRYHEIDSPFGHDGFLVEHEQLNDLLRHFMEQ